MGCNQSKPGVVKETVVKTRSKDKDRRCFLKLLKRKRVNKVAPLASASDTIFDTDETSGSIKPSPIPPAKAIPSYHVVKNLYGYLKIVPVEELTPPPSPPASGEEVYVQARSFHDDEAGSKKYNFESSCCREEYITEKSVTVAEEVDLELDRPPTPNDLTITGVQIQPVLSGEESEAFSMVGEEFSLLNDHIDNTPWSFNQSSYGVIMNSPMSFESGDASTDEEDIVKNQNERRFGIENDDRDWRSSHVMFKRKREGQPRAVLVKKAWE